MTHARSPESGNIVIYILGAIFLMGLLIVMVRGSSQPGANIDAEGLAIKVSEVQQYANELERAVGFIQQNGYSETDIRFAHPSAHADYNAAGDINDIPARQVFNKSGGGATWREPPSGVQTTLTPWIFNANSQVRGIGTTASTNASADLVAILPYVTKDFCVAINKASNVNMPSGTPPADDGTVDITTKFAGIYDYNSWIADAAPTLLAGKKEGCFEGGGTPAAGTYHYYRVLLAR